MLRQKFMVVLGVIVTLHVVMALLSIFILHGVLRDLDAAGEDALESVAAIQRVRAELDAAYSRPDEDPTVLASLARHVAALHDSEMMRESESAVFIASVQERIDTLAPEVAGGRVPDTWRIPIRSALDELDSHVTALIAQRRDDITAKFRYSALFLGIIFVLILNATVMVLSRMVSMIVKPVDQLVEASRRLAREEFDHRVNLKRRDEFGELASAYNALAEQLQRNEERKIETLHQVARTLSHEINNAIAIIELQLTQLARSTTSNGAQGDRLREIHQSLGRINSTINTLTHVRRIVLTDYTPGSGMLMLDLERSARLEATDRPE